MNREITHCVVCGEALHRYAPVFVTAAGALCRECLPELLRRRFAPRPGKGVCAQCGGLFTRFCEIFGRALHPECVNAFARENFYPEELGEGGLI